MADQLDPEQINNLNKNLENLIETLSGTATKSTNLSKGMGDLLGVSKPLQGLLGGLGTSAGNLGKSLYKGEKGAGVFGDAVEEAAGAVGALLVVLAPFSLAAKLAAVAITAFAKGINAAAKQGDALYKTYQDLQKSGATAADGITGVFNNMQNFGYGIEELDKMVKLVADNSETLAKFSLTAADGTQAFSSAMQGLVRDRGLKELGKMPEEINAAGAAYIKQQVAAGRSQKDIGDNLTEGTRKYIMDLDRLQRLTGTSADALQKQQDEALSEDAYNDVMAELDKRAAEGDVAAQAQIKKITTTMASLSPEMQKQFQRSIGGDISAQQQLFMRMPSLMQNVMDESVSVGDTMHAAKKDIDNYVDTFGRSYRINSAGMREFGGTLRSAREEALQFGQFDERNAAAEKNATVTDEATKNLAKINLEQMNSRDALQSFVQLGVAPATKALAGLSDVTTGITRMLPGQGLGGASSVGSKLDALAASGAGGSNSILATIRQRESGGNYTAQAKGSTASGAYQFIDKTWQSLTQKYGIGTEFKSAKMAPKEVQDAIAKKYVDEILKQAGGDVSKVPLAWYTGNVQGKISPEAMAANKGLTPEMYQRSWMADYSKMGGVSGPLGGYNSKTASVRPDSTLPGVATSTPAQPAQAADATDSLMNLIADKLEGLNRHMSSVADNTKKTAQYAGA